MTQPPSLPAASLVAIDIGNSRIKVGSFPAAPGCAMADEATPLPIVPPAPVGGVIAEPADVWAFAPTDADGEPERFEGLIAWLTHHAPSGTPIVVGSVSPATTERLLAALAPRSGVRVLVSRDMPIANLTLYPESHMALIPVENSTIGTVQPAAGLVAASGLRVVGEVWRPIRLALMAPPGARLSSLKTVESHPAALGQCRGALAELRLEAREVFDTAGAARAVAASGDLSRAAVAPPSAAEIYGLSILRHDIQDRVGNRTRFVLLEPPQG